jgi:2-polyprenyl-6-hydroxyphenyl methylase/3-demethylubiquinone-9 3-methyltransferase
MINREIYKFTSIAEKWWDLDGPFKMLHNLNPLRLKFVLDNCLEKKESILDLGCGGGIFCEAAANNGFSRVCGVDLGLENIEIAQEHAKQNGFTNIEYFHSDIKEIFQSNDVQFDIITAFEVVEHCDDWRDFLNSAIRLLKPGGLFFVSTINRNVKSYFQAILAAEYVLRWVPRGTHEWKKFLKPSEIAEHLDKVDLVLKSANGIKFDILSCELIESNDLDVNYMLCFEKK